MSVDGDGRMVEKKRPDTPFDAEIMEKHAGGVSRLRFLPTSSSVISVGKPATYTLQFGGSGRLGCSSVAPIPNDVKVNKRCSQKTCDSFVHNIPKLYSCFPW
jgi:hypothetical protein